MNFSLLWLPRSKNLGPTFFNNLLPTKPRSAGECPGEHNEPWALFPGLLRFLGSGFHQAKGEGA